MTQSNSEECVELKNIKYKTMLLSGVVIPESKSTNNLDALEKFLEDDKNNNQIEPWSKLDKTIKTQKLIVFAEKYSSEKNYNEEEKTILVTFLKDCLDRKKLNRVKDVDYDKVKGEIKDIPSLFFNKNNKHFTLKNLDKRVSTLKSLPPKMRGTLKNNKTKSEVSSESDDN
jgi:hypothetical protein